MDFSNLKCCLDRMITEYHTPGVDCIVCKNHEILFRYFTGMSDLENRKPVIGKELYIIFSMTKMLTCVSALQLLEKGAYTLDDPVSQYLPEFEKMKIADAEFDVEAAAKIASGEALGEGTALGVDGYAENPITVRHLFTMGAGLDYNLNSEPIVKARAEGKKTTREYVKAISETVLGFEPGTRFRYSLCHDVLGALVEVWSGQKLGDYMQEHLFEPLGMNNTFFGVPKDGETRSRMAARYTYDENRMPKRLPLECVFNFSEEYQSGGAGLISCTEDYALFLDALACGGVGKTGERILNTETVKLMGTNQLSGKPLEDFDKMRPGYGYGLGVRTHLKPDVSGSLSPVGEFGWDGAAGAFSMVDLGNGLSLTYFQQIHAWDLKIQQELRNALYADLAAN